MKYAELPQEIRNANALVVDIQGKIKDFKGKIAELQNKPEYQNALKVLQEQGAKLRASIEAEISAKMQVLKALKPKRSGNGSKATYSFKVEGQQITIANNGKTLTVPLSEVGYNTAFIGNAEGATGKIARIDLTFQQGKSLVKAIKG